jgi:hypothetical protein
MNKMESMKKKAIKISILVLIFSVITLLVGCNDTTNSSGNIIVENSTGDEVKITYDEVTITDSSPNSPYIPINSSLVIPDAEAAFIKARPIIYALAINKEYTIRNTITRYRWLQNAEMEFSIELPPKLELVSGDTYWRGTGEQKVIEQKVRTLELGEIEISSTVTNLDMEFVGFPIDIIIKAIIFNSDTEAKAYVDKRNEEFGKEKNIPMEIITDANE